MNEVSKNKSVVCVIPARFASTRLPAKPLLDICGAPLIQRVYERANLSGIFSEVIVATDDERIHKIVCVFGGKAVMTSSKHNSGTDRIAEAVKSVQQSQEILNQVQNDYDIIVNIQGDEPLFCTESVKEMINSMISDNSIEMATLRFPLIKKEEINNSNIVKVVVSNIGNALYFSRSPIPYIRDEQDRERQLHKTYWKHIGIYAYRRDVLFKFVSLETSFLERTEKLEQLRALENGISIRVFEAKKDSIGVDTREDLENVRTLFNESVFA